MDAKNDDSSGGSDSLDKSLQKKCVVDDIGQGEGGSTATCGIVNESEKRRTEQLLLNDKSNENSNKKQKTERGPRDPTGSGIDDGGGGGGVDLPHTRDTLKSKAQMPGNDLLDTPSTSRNSNVTVQLSQTAAATNSTTSNKAFETKVKQISKDLKETTLAETVNKTKTSLEDSTSSSSSSSSEGEQTGATACSLQGAGGPQTSEMDTSMHSANESIDEQDHRSKKVRFHPDVKENDGGNRVIPKKKKKLKASGSNDDASCSTGQRTTNADEEMDLDDEEVEEEEEFDLAKTIAEAENYLKTHPLSFVRAIDKNETVSSARLKGGLQGDFKPPVVESSEDDEDLYKNVPPECGVARILGKQIKGGRAEYLLRYADQPGIYWRGEEFVLVNCPSLLNKYEINRDRRQEKLMRDVAKRQNLRQRYTDF